MNQFDGFKEFIWDATNNEWTIGLEKFKATSLEGDLHDSLGNIIVNHTSKHVDVSTVTASGLIDAGSLTVQADADVLGNLEVTGTLDVTNTVTFDTLATNVNAIVTTGTGGVIVNNPDFRFTGTNF